MVQKKEKKAKKYEPMLLNGDYMLVTQVLTALIEKLGWTQNLLCSPVEQKQQELWDSKELQNIQEHEV